MKRLFIIPALLLATLATAQAGTLSKKHTRSHADSHSQSDSGVTVYDRDSRDPNVGWHTENGMRVCSHDCDNPEIPGSGAVCRNVNVMGMAMRECVTGN